MVESKSLARNPDVSWRTIEGQAVLIHNKLGEVQVLNEVGTYIWEHFEDGPEALARNISCEWKVSEGEARADVEEFVQELLKSGAAVHTGDG